MVTQSPLRERIELPTVGAEHLIGSAARAIIDLRSPAEFARDHVPGARNLPLFDDVERALVGTLYRWESPQAAFVEGGRYVRTHIAQLVAQSAEIAGWPLVTGGIESEVEALLARGLEGLAGTLVETPVSEPPSDAVLFHCWRGGLRSRSVVALLRGLGFDRALMVAGGYKAWRRHVLGEIESWSAPRAFVLRGWTGVGKTLVLREIENLRPGWTIDLEALAGHRSSLLGMIGLEPCSQKAFESRLVARMRALNTARMRAINTAQLGAVETSSIDAPPVVFEGESRKVGDVILPASVWKALDHGTNLALVAGIGRRVEVLKEDYLTGQDARAELLRQLPLIEARMARDAASPSLCALLERGAVDELVGILLEQYYDPLYRHSERGRRHAASFDATDPGRAAREIVSWIENALAGATG